MGSTLPLPCGTTSTDTLLNAGLNPDELTSFFFHEHGLNFPEDGIYALEKHLS